MEIQIKYPDITAQEYLSSLDSFNADIDNKNRTFKLRLPRIIAGFTSALTLLLILLVLRKVYYKMVYWMTARDELIVILCLAGYLFLLLGSVAAVYIFSEKQRHSLIVFLGGAEYEEKYTLSEYAERKDIDKKAKKELLYYEMCDLLKASSILDASIVCRNDDCRVDISYELRNGKESGLLTFNLPYRTNASAPVTIVDLDRRLVILNNPIQEAEENEENA